jgi:N-acetyl-1-D-myo-inositol-2-amino-2-deoxy-alpha-D-glucopyranoside deacetylase
MPSGTTGVGRPARQRLLLVHAHPDDETLSTGLTMAHAAAAGVQVTLVTCTLGQEGEVVPERLRHLTSAADDELGAWRAEELASAMGGLGVSDHRLLADGRWRDSGMTWLAPGRAGPAATARPNAFCLADLDEAAEQLAAVLREVRPQVVVTYDPAGGYGHPDHVMAHRVTMRAVDLAERPAGRPGWAVPAVHWVQVAVSWAQDDRRAVRAAAAAGRLPQPMRPPVEGAEPPAAVVDDAALDVVLRSDPGDRAAVRAALRAHASQVRLSPPWFALTDDVAHRLPTAEGFRRVRGPAVDPTRRPADDLFVGLPL